MNDFQKNGVAKALEPYMDSAPTDNVVPFKRPELNSKSAAAFANLPHESLSDGLETPIEEIRSAVSTIPSSAISAEPEWMKLARALAWQAKIFPERKEVLWEILDAASRRAPGYDEEDNRRRFDRYISEAGDHENPITIATVFHMALEHGWNGRSPPLVTSAEAEPSAWNASDLRVSFSNIPHRHWLYGTYLIRGEITVVAAPGGAGKTALATGMAVEIATNKSLLGEKIWGGDNLKVLFLNAEDSGIEISRRVWAFCLAHSDKIAGQPLDRLYVAGADDPRVQKLSFLRTTERNVSVLDQNGFQVLEAGLQSVHPDVLILDPLVAFCGGGNMNDNAAMSLVMRELKRLATDFDCAVLIVHHTRKGGDAGNPEAISGAAATVNLSRRAIMPVPMTHEDAEHLKVLPSQRHRYFKVVDAKSNLAPRSDDSPWYELHSVELPNSEPPTYPFGDSVQAIARVMLPLVDSASVTADDQKIRRAILDLVERGKMIDGQRYPYSPNLTGAKNERALLEDAMVAVADGTAPQQWHSGNLRTVVKRAIERLKSEKWLVEGGEDQGSSLSARRRAFCRLVAHPLAEGT